MMPSATHPSFEFDQHQFIGAIDQREISDGAVSIAAVVESQVIPGATQTTDLRITADDNIERSTDPGDLAPQIRPAGVHIQFLITVRWFRFWTLRR